MTTETKPARHIDDTDLRSGRKGECRRCGKPVRPPRRSWCSQQCVDDYLIRAQPSYASHLVGERDKGVCRVCGIDTSKLRRILRHTKAMTAIWTLGEMGFERVSWPRKLWERDHIVAVAEGGGSCGLENYQTLCIPCHRAKTAGMRKRLAGG